MSNTIQTQHIAILFTGQIRTLEKTIQNFKKNILDNNPTHIIHVYAVLEYPHHLDEQEKIQEKQEYLQKHEQIFQKYTHNNLKKIHWLSSQDEELKKHKEQVLQNLHISDGWKDYLGNRSGSISEYYQLNIGIRMIRHESTSFSYHYFMRTRCDIMIPNLITFDPLGENNENLLKRYQAIEKIYPQSNKMALFCYFIESLYYPFPFPDNARFMLDADPTYNKKYVLESFLPDHIQDINQVFDPYSEKHEPNGYSILEFPYVHVHRQNLYYLSKNSMCELKYGYNKVNETKYVKGIEESNCKESNYWFNSENQYEIHVIKMEQKVLVNSYTELEESSLYDYNEKNYSNPPQHLLFYLCRD